MVFYTVIMGIRDLSISRMQIGQDIRKTKGPLRVIVCVCWRKSSFIED